MGKKIIYIIFLLFTIWTFYKSFEKTNDKVFNEIKEKIVYVKDAKVKSENNDKLVLITGKINSDNVFNFEDINFKFKTCKIDVQVQELENNEWVDSKYSKKQVVDIKIGEFLIDKDLVNKISYFPYYTKNIEGYINDYDETGYYISEDGKLRFKFQYVNLDKEYTIIGKQVGNKIEKYELKSTNVPVYKIYTRKINDEKQLEKVLVRDKKRSRLFIGLILIIVLYIGYGIFFKKTEI